MSFKNIKTVICNCIFVLSNTLKNIDSYMQLLLKCR